MSCYFRHLKEIFDEAGIKVTSGNRKQIDQAIHQLVGVTYKECPHAWKTLKQQIIDNEPRRQELVKKLKATMG
jgi:predicted Fe-Mo cluster-binding NifX family protein